MQAAQAVVGHFLLVLAAREQLVKDSKAGEPFSLALEHIVDMAWVVAEPAALDKVVAGTHYTELKAVVD
jgi:hypothetical protein